MSLATSLKKAARPLREHARSCKPHWLLQLWEPMGVLVKHCEQDKFPIRGDWLRTWCKAAFFHSLDSEDPPGAFHALANAFKSPLVPREPISDAETIMECVCGFITQILHRDVDADDGNNEGWISRKAQFLEWATSARECVKSLLGE